MEASIYKLGLNSESTLKRYDKKVISSFKDVLFYAVREQMLPLHIPQDSISNEKTINEVNSSSYGRGASSVCAALT